MPVVFIDRSNVNGSDNYSSAPVTHLYLKVTEGTGFVDSTYTARRSAGKAAGAATGGYHFARHGAAEAEADFFLAHLNTADTQTGALRPCLDLEDGQSVQWAAAFLKHCKDKLGYYPVLYGSTSFIAPMRSSLAHPLAARRVRKAPWWRAEFGTNDGNRHDLAGGVLGAAAHQYTSTAHVDGISGETDRSVFIAEAEMMVPAAKLRRPISVYKDGKHIRNFRTRTGAYAWLARRRHPRRGHQVQVRNRGDAA